MTNPDADFVFIDYPVSGKRAAVDVLWGRSELTGISVVHPDGRCDFFSGDFQHAIASLGTRRRIYHDAVFSRAVERKYGLPLAPVFDCTRTMAHLLNENLSWEFADLLNRAGALSIGPIQVHGSTVSSPLPLNSAALAWLGVMHSRMLDQIAAEQLDYVYRQIELAIVDPVIAMAQTGISIDVERLHVIHDSHETQCCIGLAQLAQIAGRFVDVASHDDVVRYLFDELNLQPMAATRRGGPSTKQDALEPLREHHPVVGLIIQIRQMQTVVSTAKSLIDSVHGTTGRVHPSLDPLGATTGRLSCRDPNLQALAAPLLEAVVTGDDGQHLAELDYCQMELRVLAYVAQDPDMCHAFVHGQDIHRVTAAKLFGSAPECISADQRAIGKSTNFGIVYGQEAMSLATKLRTSQSQAAEWIRGFRQGYPAVSRFLNEQRIQAMSTGIVSTYFGRRRRPRFAECESRADHERALRQAVNAIVQGTAADLNKLAMSRIHERMPQCARMLFNSHDAFLFQIPREEAHEVLLQLQQLMEELPAGWMFPMPVTTKTGRHWLECKG